MSQQHLAPAEGTANNLPALLAALDADASLVQRHLWLIGLFAWIRGTAKTADRDKAAAVQAAVARLQAFMDAVRLQPALAVKLQRWWQALLQGIDISTLLADFGFAPRTAFVSELSDRLRRKVLPATPDTTDASELFLLVASSRFDALWLGALDESHLQQLADLLTSDAAAQARAWQHNLLDALTYCSAQIRATGFAPELRLRMDEKSRQARPFHALPSDVDELREAFQGIGPAASLSLLHSGSDDNSGSDASARLQAAVQRYRARLDDCRQAINSMYAHLQQHGISVGLVFRLRQLRARMLRARELLEALLAPSAPAAVLKLLVRRVITGHDSKSIGALISSNSTLLSAKMAERSAETGERYITRNRAEYQDMLGKAMGGGAVTALTTLLKFSIGAIGLSAFWGGFWSGAAYAASFVLIQLLHFTLATKQPAMTAPAMAAKLKDIDSPAAMADFVDEVANLVRSQVAAVLGNVTMVVPAVLLVNALMVLLLGRPMIATAEAAYVLQSLSLLGPTLLWAAFTGVILFVASMVGGWAENWFVLHRLDSAVAHNPRITGWLGTVRAGRWSAYLARNVSGFASNIALGFMLGLVPALTGFFALELEMRHVTLSAGQLAAAAASLGSGVLGQSAFWWALAAIPLIGALNLGVSFYLALRLAVQAHNLSRIDQRRIRGAIWLRWRRAPEQFFLPGRQAIDR